MPRGLTRPGPPLSGDDYETPSAACLAYDYVVAMLSSSVDLSVTSYADMPRSL